MEIMRREVLKNGSCFKLINCQIRTKRGDICGLRDLTTVSKI